METRGRKKTKREGKWIAINQKWLEDIAYSEVPYKGLIWKISLLWSWKFIVNNKIHFRGKNDRARAAKVLGLKHRSLETYLTLFQHANILRRIGYNKYALVTSTIRFVNKLNNSGQVLTGFCKKNKEKLG